MKTINLELDLTEMSPNQISALAAFVLSFGPGQISAPQQTPAPIETKKVKATKETFVDPQANASAMNAAVAQTENKGTEEPPEPTVKLEDVRALLGEKIGDHRDKIRAKLSELDAKNVSVMKPEKYDEFYCFLKDL